MPPENLAAAAINAAPGSRYERKKEDILNTAASLINRNGLRDTTLAVVAAELGMNLKSLRYYFTRKEELACAAFLRSVELHEELIASSRDIDDFDERIRHFIASYFALKGRVRRGQQPPFVHFGDIRSLADERRTKAGNRYVDFFRGTRSLLDCPGLAMPAAQKNAAAHFLVSQLLWSVIWTQPYETEDFDRVAERFTDLLLNGIAARPVTIPAPPGEMHNAFEDPDRLSQNAFLRTATHLINDLGYRGATVEKISSELNVTKGAFYHHNETREELVSACFDRTFEIIREAQDSAMRTPADGLTRTILAASSLVSRQMLPEGALLRTSALTAVGFELREELQHRMGRTTMRFADMLNDGLLDGSVRPSDIRIASEMITAAINSAQELQNWVREARADNAAELYLTPLLYGLGAARDRTRAPRA